MNRAILSTVVLILTVTGCASNPVTGKKQLKLVSSAQERAIGEQQYGPSRQMQGGDYTIEPELTAYVQEVGNRVARASGVNLPYEFTILNNSVPNAWAMPGGKIAINRGLLTEMNSEAELAAVLGHEVTHSAASHGASAMTRGMLLQIGMIAVQVGLRDNDYAQYIVGGANLGAQLISSKYGRDKELESDLYGMRFMSEAGYDPAAAVDLQQTFVKISQGSGRRNDFISGLFASHPPSQQRVNTNRNTLTTLPPGGEYGRERYQRMIAGIKRNAPAYKAHDDAVNSLREGNYQRATQLAQQAINLEPRESKFYSLMGDTYRAKGDHTTAIQFYNTSLERNSNHFQPYLTRAISNLQLGNWQVAEQDLKQSIRLLPTAPAYHQLGLIALETGRTQEAVQYLEQAATSDSDVGRAAGATLAKLQLQSNPERYLQGRLGLDNRGYLVVQIQNAAPVAVNNVQLAIVLLNQQGQIVQKETLNVRETLPAQQVRNLPTRLGPITDQNQLQFMRVVVERAQVAQ
ncbi:MAG: M48 family metalloprotease [Gammaproteobacteria bacterium]